MIFRKNPPEYRSLALLMACAALPLATPAFAQDEDGARIEPNDPLADSVFNGDWVTIGAGVGVVPSYDGSDDYVVFPLPLLQGSLGGVDINTRPAGLALDFIEDKPGQMGMDLGFTARVRSNRTGDFEDPVVAQLGELDTAIEVGPTAGLSFPGVLNPFDSVTATVDVRWDVAGAHKGMVVDPSVAYFTPLSRGTIASLSVSTSWVDDSYAGYYYDVTPAGSLASGLPVFTAEGGFTRVGANLLVGVDLDGDATNGGLAVVLIGGYSRLLGDARRTPITSIRGSADQWLGGVGVAYTF